MALRQDTVQHGSFTVCNFAGNSVRTGSQRITPPHLGRSPLTFLPGMAGHSSCTTDWRLPNPKRNSVAIVRRQLSAWVVTGVAALASVLAGVSTNAAATITVNSGGNLQAALNAAAPGDTIVLAAGARFTGQFVLPVKPAGEVITIRSSANVPLRRITPADTALMPTIVSGEVESALSATGTSNWRLEGLRFEAISAVDTLIALQDVTNITLDRVLIVGGPLGLKRGVMGNGRQVTLTRSHIANIWSNGVDSQAFAAWDGAGPYTITDNYLEAASENVLFGGADSAAPDRIPSDITVTGNHFSKQVSWRGQPKNVKNLFELKSARRVVVRQNLFEHNWTDGQSGTAILFTPRNENGRAPWSVVQDVLFENNIIRDTEGVFNVSGRDDVKASGQTTGITIRNNLCMGSGRFLLLANEVGTLTIDHNTVDQGANFATIFPGDVMDPGATRTRPSEYAAASLTITNDLANHGEYGVWGEGLGVGTAAFSLTRSYIWTNNVLAGGAGNTYPPVTWLPSVAEHRQNFNADYTLVTSSKYRAAGSDGKDLGVLGSLPTALWPPAGAGTPRVY